MLRRWAGPGDQPINAVTFTPDGSIVAAGDANGHVYLWHAASGGRAGTFTDPSSTGVKAVAVSPDGKTVAAGDANADVYLWDISSLDC
jgi:WD40 repeat protein